MRAVEKFYSVEETALLLSLCTKTVLEKMKARELGEDVINVSNGKQPNYRIPASGINGYLARRRIFSESVEIGIVARSPGELRRKANALPVA